jgi:hypothetical protein
VGCLHLEAAGVPQAQLQHPATLGSRGSGRCR